MKKIVVLIMAVLGIQQISQAQSSSEKYIISGGELIFSFANTDGAYDDILRFSPFFNFQSWRVHDYGDYGFFYGIAIRNVGFILDDDATNTRVKIRTYNLGIPVGAIYKLTPNTEVYAGYEFEIPFNYKEKTFINEEKEDKFNTWFSDRTPTLNHAVFGGVQFMGGMNIKFKYYLNNFFDKDYRFVEDGVTSYPYADFDVHVFYFALSFNIFKNKTLVIDEVWTED